MFTCDNLNLHNITRVTRVGQLGDTVKCIHIQAYMGVLYVYFTTAFKHCTCPTCIGSDMYHYYEMETCSQDLITKLIEQVLGSYWFIVFATIILMPLTLSTLCSFIIPHII